MRYSEDTGQPIFTDAEQVHISIAEDDMERLKSIKQDFYSLMEKVRKYAEPKKEDFEYGYIAIEQELDELLSNSWKDATDRAYSDESLSKSGFYVDWLIRRENRIAAKSVITNPQTLQFLGVEI